MSLQTDLKKRGAGRVISALPYLPQTVYEGPDTYQQPSGRVGNPLDITDAVLYLCSDKAGFINGENICIDGGMTHQMIFHADNGRTLS